MLHATKEKLSYSAIEQLEMAQKYINDARLGQDVIDLLLPNGRPLADETCVWDYKITFPTPNDARSSGEHFQAMLHDVVKDVVAFHNSYGGYIIAGVRNGASPIYQDFDKDFDCHELAKSIFNATGVLINCRFEYVEYTCNGLERKAGILHVPKRRHGDKPVMFRTNARSLKNGDKAFSADQIYFRWNDECMPASKPDHFIFLVSERVLGSHGDSAHFRKIKANLPARDPELIQYVDRPNLTTTLWNWFSDSRDPVRVFVGPGGLGKTTVAYRFAEDIISHSSAEIDRVIWLGAKQKTFSVFMDKLVNVARTDYSDKRSFFMELLNQLAVDTSEFDDDIPTEMLSTILCSRLKDIPSLVIVDDIDSLDSEEQIELFSACQELFNQAVTFERPSKALITSRYKLPAGARQIISMPGLDDQEFIRYVESQCIFHDISIEEFSKEDLDDLLSASSGSPIFVSSILKMVAEKVPLKKAISDWRGLEGEAVRRFVFEREVSRLEPSQARILFAVCLMGEATRAELEEITGRSKSLIKSDIVQLQSYHMVTSKNSKDDVDPKLAVSSHLRLLVDLIEKRLTPSEAETLRKNCARVIGRTKQVDISVRRHIRAVVALRNGGAIKDAISAATLATSEFPSNGDLKCLLGLTLLLDTPPRHREADEQFRQAISLNCQRQDLIDYSIITKEYLGDWIGILVIIKGRDISLIRPKAAVAVANAYAHIANQSRERGAIQQVANESLEAGEALAVYVRCRKNFDERDYIVEKRNELMREYFRLTSALNSDHAHGIKVFDAMMKCLEGDYINEDILGRGLTGILDWWSVWENIKPKNSFRARSLQRNLDRFPFLERKIDSIFPKNRDFHDKIDVTKRRLSAALVAYSGSTAI